MKLKLLFLLLTTSAFYISHAQFKTCGYDKQKMKFKIMQDMEVTANTDTKFEAKDKDFYLGIATITGKTYTYDGMKDGIVEIANKVKGFTYSLDVINRGGGKQPMYLTELDHFWGITVEGQQNGDAITLVLLVNPDNPDISYIVYFRYDVAYYREVKIILNSFQPE